MAYGVLYEFRRTSSNGADMLITISQKDYTGAVKKRALGRAPVIKRENNDHIYGTSCELYAECLVDGEFSHLYTSDAYEFKVEVYKNNILLWAGFVSPELYSEPDIAPPYDVQIIATDGLGELKNCNFNKRGVASILDHLDTLMANTGLGMDFYVVSGLRYINADGTASEEKDILSVKLDLDHEEGNSCYDVLQGLLSSLNANITQHNGRYLIFRETDFISKASATGVEAFSENGSKINLPIAGFGSMKSNQWWPVGQLSTVIEPAKNHLTLKSPNHYKENVLSFDNWVFSGLASYSEADNAYVLPGADSAITQTVDFGDHEVGYRLGLRVRARNVGTPGDEEQNIGIKVEVNGRSYSVGKTFWLVKSANTSGRPINDYLFHNTEGYIEEDLPTPTEDATSSDAQDIDIVVPLHASGSRSYVYAKNVKLTIFNPTGLYDIHVYDVSLVKYEQIKGYEANVIIENIARESESDIDLTITAGDLAPAAGDVFMTGLPLRSSDSEVITKWQIGLGQAQDYLAALAFDYSRAISLPRMKYSGILNVPGSATILPTLFLRDGTYYFPKTYSYDLYADEITIDLISISAADVSLSSVQISQTSEAAGTMGTTTGGPAGGGSPSAKSLAQLDDVRISNSAVGDIFAFGGKEWENMSFQKVVNEYLPLLKTLGDWFYKTDDGLSIGTKYNLFSEQEMSANGLSVGPGGSGSGLISQVYGITAFGTIAAESNSATFNAYAIDSLYKRIVSLEGKATAVSFVPALTSGKQIGTLSIDGVSKVLYAPAGYAWSEVSGKPTLIESEGVAVDGSLKVNRFGLWQGKGAYWSIGHDSNYVIQAYATANGVYLRSLTGGTDSGWKRILREGDAYSKADADSTFLKLSGGEINGYLDISHATQSIALGVKSKSTDYVAIRFTGANGNSAYLVYSGNGDEWAVTPPNWAGSRILLHSGNFGDYVVSKAGGTITKRNDGVGLVIDTPDTHWAGIRFKPNTASVGATLNYNGTDWRVTDDGWNQAFSLLHSGNYNSYAPKLDGTGASGTWGINISGTASISRTLNTSVFSVINANEISYTDCSLRYLAGVANTSTNLPSISSYQNALIAIPLHDNGATAQMYFSKDYAEFYYRSHQSYAWRTVAFTDSNVASADTASTLEKHTVIPMTAETAGKWRQFAKLQASYRYSGRSASFQLSVSSSSGKNGAVCDVYAMMYQQDALGSAPIYTIQTNCDDRKLKIAAVLNYDSSGSTITLYAYCPTIYTGVSMVVPSRNGDVVSIGTELLSELPSGTVITPDKTGTSFAATKLITASGNNYAYHSDASKYTVFGASGYNCYIDGVATYFRYGANSTIGMTINSSGNVTIGTSDLASTTRKLFVGTSSDNFSIASTGSAFINTTNTSGWERSFFIAQNGTRVFGIGAYGTASMEYGYIGSSYDKGLMYFKGENVGIGTNAPEHKLHVNGNVAATATDTTPRSFRAINTNGAISLLSSTSRGVYDSTNSRWLIGTNGTNSFLLCGNVGIGTDAPVYKLDVNGSMNVVASGATARHIHVTNSVGKMSLHVAASGRRGLYDSTIDNWMIYTDSTSVYFPSKPLSITHAVTMSSSLSVSGLLTANSGVKVASGQALTFLDASGKEHKLTYDSTAGAFKFDGNILVLGDGQFNAIN